MPITPKETKDADKVPKPTKPEFEARQLTFFQHFLANTDAERDRLSNLIDLWDNVPRYSVSRKHMAKARVNGRFLERHVTEFQYKGRQFTCTLFPARVEDLDGTDRDYYASGTEELVEDALRKIAIDQQAGYFDKMNYRCGVVFTLYQLREELKNRGHSRSYQEIVLALNILSGSIIEIRADGEEGKMLTRSTYLPHLAVVTRTRLLDDPKAKWVVQFHPLITGSIDTVTYRQYNYALMMSHRTQLARWLHKQLVLKYTFASVTKPFETRYSTIRRDSGLLDAYNRPRDAIDALEAALSELKASGIVHEVQRKDITGTRGKLEDVVFTLFSSLEFMGETKAASKRLNDTRGAHGNSSENR